MKHHREVHISAIAPDRLYAAITSLPDPRSSSGTQFRIIEEPDGRRFEVTFITMAVVDPQPHWVWQPIGAVQLLDERPESMPAETNLLARIPGERIVQAAQELPEAANAPDKPYHVDIRMDGRAIRLTFRRFKHKRHKTTRWLWTCEEAEILSE